MSDMTSSDAQNEALFMNLVMMFQGMAYQHLGKVMNPATQKVERDIDQARAMIDMLGMLEAKTKGNLGGNERKFLDHALFELRMNYVDELEKDKQAAAGKAEAAGEKAEASPETAESSRAAAGEKAEASPEAAEESSGAPEDSA